MLLKILHSNRVVIRYRLWQGEDKSCTLLELRYSIQYVAPPPKIPFVKGQIEKGVKDG